MYPSLRLELRSSERSRPDKNNANNQCYILSDWRRNLTETVLGPQHTERAHDE